MSKGNAKIFIGGSSKITELGPKVTQFIFDVIDKEHTILIGDGNGVDLEVQRFLKHIGYKDVQVFQMKDNNKNNLGKWKNREFEIEPDITPANPLDPKNLNENKLRDNALVESADYGLVVWNGKSKGVFNIIIKFLTAKKKVWVFFYKTKKLVCFSKKEEVDTMFKAEETEAEASA